MEEHPGHPEDLRTIEVLRRIQSAFQEPRSVSAPADTPDLGSNQDVERTAYEKFRKPLDQLYSKFSAGNISMKVY